MPDANPTLEQKRRGPSFIIICGIWFAAIPILYILYLLVMVVLPTWGVLPHQGMRVRSELAYVSETMRDLHSSISHRTVSGEGYFESGYWGPIDASMLATLEISPQRAIDPFNRSAPRGRWRTGSKYQTDRGASVRIRGGDFWLYWAGPEGGAIVSRGPDGDLDVTPEELRDIPITGRRIDDLLPDRLYDVSNGTISDGDLIRLVQIE